MEGLCQCVREEEWICVKNLDRDGGVMSVCERGRMDMC